MTPLPGSLVAVDWGTSSFRAYLVDSSGLTTERIANTDGILAVAQTEFPIRLKHHLAPWLDRLGPLPVVMSGMIGSRQGWVEAPYVPAPATPGDVLAAVQSITVDGLGPVLIAPGVMTRDNAGIADVMRGEETQVFGALALTETADGLFVVPGTHSKWISVDNGAISHFQTYMTGEIYAVLRDHSILGRLMPAAASSANTISAGFRRGLDDIARHGGGPGGLLNRLFSVRTRGLFAELPAEQLPDYLSGILIGAEIIEAAPSDRTVSIIANETLAARYRLACQALGVACLTMPHDCVVAGLWAIASASRSQVMRPSP